MHLGCRCSPHLLLVQLGTSTWALVGAAGVSVVVLGAEWSRSRVLVGSPLLLD